MKMLKKYALNEQHEMPIKHEKSCICRERSTIGKTTLADLGSSGESRAGSRSPLRSGRAEQTSTGRFAPYYPHDCIEKCIAECGQLTRVYSQADASQSAYIRR